MISQGKQNEKPVFFKGRSRLGCIHCKKSKVKCDEIHPSCSRCLKRGIHCSYPFQVSFEKSMGISQVEKTSLNTSKYGKITSLHTLQYEPFKKTKTSTSTTSTTSTIGTTTTTSSLKPNSETNLKSDTDTKLESSPQPDVNSNQLEKSSEQKSTTNTPETLTESTVSEIRSMIRKNKKNRSKIDKVDDFAKVVKIRAKK